MIPKIIHYTWFTRDKKHRLPDEIRKGLLNWKKIFSNWDIKLWNFNNFDTNISKITRQANSKDDFNTLRDYVKIWAINTYGGIYINPYLQITEPLDDLLIEKLFLGLGQDSISWDIIGCERRNLVTSELLRELNRLENNNIKVDSVLTKTLTLNYNFSIDSPTIQKLDRFTIFPKSTFNSNHYIPGITKTINTSCDLGKNKNPLISIVMPSWNSEAYINESIDSVLCQTFKDFELIIVDDGSTDNTKSIIKSYSDPRIVLIEKTHSGISDALNLGIEKSRGIYIARMDSDDIMYEDRLYTQLKYMENNPEVDILGTGFEWGNGKKEKEYYTPRTGPVTLEELINIGNKLGHPTVMMRKNSILKLPGGIYEAYYNGSEDYKLWITALQEGLVIHNLKTPTLYYRQHSNQVSENPTVTYRRIKNAYTRKNNEDTELTVIIPFKNEGIEIEKTVASVRATSCCNIVLINDFSTDNTNYKKIADKFDCDYYESKYPLGVAGGRNLGVSKIKTPYFVLLDGHMRFYDDDWDLRVVKHLKEHPESIITSNTSIINKEEGQPYKNEDGKDIDKKHGSKAAVINFKEPGWEFTGKWTNKTGILDLPDELSQCSCVMGAFYASSKVWWDHIGGLRGLIGWGSDESLMSIKTYLAGGKCYILRDFFVGHLYRGKAPYVSFNAGVDSNHIYLINLFSPTEEKRIEYENNLEKRIGKSRFKQAKQSFLNRYDEFEKFKEYFYSKVVKITWEEFLNINNKFY